MERRLARRFQLTLPCFVFTSAACRCSMLDTLTTVDISSTGAYVLMHIPFALDTRLHFEVLAQQSGPTNGATTGVHISTTGEVVRVDAGGMALMFSGSCDIRQIGQSASIAWHRAQWIKRFIAPNEQRVDAVGLLAEF